MTNKYVKTVTEMFRTYIDIELTAVSTEKFWLEKYFNLNYIAEQT